jgi:hypothetical protein
MSKIAPTGTPKPASTSPAKSSEVGSAPRAQSSAPAEVKSQGWSAQQAGGAQKIAATQAKNANATVQALFNAIGHGEPKQVMKGLTPLLAEKAQWVVPAGNGLTSGHTPTGSGVDAKVSFQGAKGIEEYVGRLYNLSGQGAEGAPDPKFHPSLVSVESTKVLPNKSIEVIVQAEATAVRGDVALDGHPERNTVEGQNGAPDTGTDGRIHGRGLYELRLNLSPDGSKIQKLETVPHDIPLFNSFWGQSPISLGGS